MPSATRLAFSDWLYEHPFGICVRVLCICALYVPAVLSQALYAGDLDVPLATAAPACIVLTLAMATFNAWLDYANVFTEPLLLFIVVAYQIARTDLNTLIFHIIVLLLFPATPVVWNCFLHVVGWRSRIINEPRCKELWLQMNYVYNGPEKYTAIPTIEEPVVAGGCELPSVHASRVTLLPIRRDRNNDSMV
ncbi:hypothetical protein B0H16DRAFT_1555819 [Mycena metata]|uniref:Uncharacterized protein n=1 Tax=Mycena metata TaxID=1033252 RepID=A0AAD7IQX5_9AGAR|nr:hypothetical protein B0H16DRAFT_1555819 [Mycena metata]